MAFVEEVIREADEQLAELWQRGVTTKTIAAEPALHALDRIEEQLKATREAQYEVVTRERDLFRREADMYKADRDEYDALLGRKMAERDGLLEQLETLEERLDIALGALHDITGMNHNDQRGTPFQFEQRIHKVAHDAWMAARGKASSPAKRSS